MNAFVKSDQQPLVLASASPRRRELLELLGVKFSVMPASIDETSQHQEQPLDYVQRMALEKAQCVARKVPDGCRVLGADTIVVIAGDILGKPRDRLQAVNYLRRLSGNTHQVFTAMAIVSGARWFTEVQLSQVTFDTLSDQQISRYVATGEPLDKAGGYAIQGLGGVFIRHLEGSYSGVMGLPLAQTGALLQQSGLTLF